MKKIKIKTMNLILVIIAVTLVVFTIEMIHLFKCYGFIPDTLCNCVFIALTGECGFMGWIKTNKDKQQSREWQLQDEERQKEYMKELQEKNGTI